MRTITLLGSTGSIGVQALDIISNEPERFCVFALTAQHNDTLLFQQCQRFHPKFAVLTDEKAAARLQDAIKQSNLKTQVLVGQDALCQVASASEVDTVLSAIVGAAALLSTMAAIEAGKRVLLANKESLVMAGELMMSAVCQQNAELLPIDSEHNGIFQCLPADYIPGQACSQEVESVVLTASGGPFLRTPLDELAEVTVQQAVAHPNWSMGAKISVDSATMMNKGLEVIEAHWLFALSASQIDVLVHPQSLVHAFVRYRDGSVLSHIADHDMHIPIAHVLAWPDRIRSGCKSLDLLQLSQIEFIPVDYGRYPCLKLAYDALREGGTASTILNAANEVAVAAFLAGRLPFNRIACLVEEVLQNVPSRTATSLDFILETDRQARAIADEIMSTVSAIDPSKAAL